ncbi:MAG: hypothetical protein J07HN6_01116 [Halonotius sp. J07HN6]|nr:MAG: hypothetical protein J07HN6_01116 [Halonotius sp. J07HN6]
MGRGTTKLNHKTLYTPTLSSKYPYPWCSHVSIPSNGSVGEIWERRDNNNTTYDRQIIS